MSEHVIPTTRIYEPPDEPRDRLRRRLLPGLALMALAGPVLLVVGVIVWAMYQASGMPSDAALQVDDCQRAVMCCEALEGEGADACRPVLELAGAGSGVPTSQQSARQEVLGECRTELRRLSASAQSRGESPAACAVTPD